MLRSGEHSRRITRPGSRCGGRATIDVGTGDGRLPFALAAADPQRLFIGVDASADNMQHWSGRAIRARLENVLYVRAAVESLPPELASIAERVTIVLPWGSLLRAVASPVVEILCGVRALCRSGATLSVILGHDPIRDRAALLRLGLPALDLATAGDQFEQRYASAGFRLSAVRPMAACQVAALPSTWAKHLARGRERRFLEIEAHAGVASPGSSR